MKKLFIVALMVLSLAIGAGNGFACEGYECGPRSSDLNLQFQADLGAYDYDYSSTGWRGNYNDHASSTADGYAGGFLDVHANADGYTTIFGWKIDNPAFVQGFGDAEAEGKAWAWSKDYGTTSKAGAGAVTNGQAFTEGLATGLYGCREFVSSEVYVGGQVSQWNEAGETGYQSGQFVEGGNQSGGIFHSVDYDYASGNGFAFDTNYIEGGMITKGKTEVSIDPYGSYRSISAMTENMVQVNAPKIQYSSIGGNGYVNGIAQKGNTFAGGNASFSYNGNTYGNGNANLNANIYSGNGQASSTVSATAYSVSDGNGGRKVD